MALSVSPIAVALRVYRDEVSRGASPEAAGTKAGQAMRWLLSGRASLPGAAARVPDWHCMLSRASAAHALAEHYQ
jgi:hypothetical protein